MWPFTNELWAALAVAGPAFAALYWAFARWVSGSRTVTAATAVIHTYQAIITQSETISLCGKKVANCSVPQASAGGANRGS